MAWKATCLWEMVCWPLGWACREGDPNLFVAPAWKRHPLKMLLWRSWCYRECHRPSCNCCFRLRYERWCSHSPILRLACFAGDLISTAWEERGRLIDSYPWWSANWSDSLQSGEQKDAIQRWTGKVAFVFLEIVSLSHCQVCLSAEQSEKAQWKTRIAIKITIGRSVLLPANNEKDSFFYLTAHPESDYNVLRCLIISIGLHCFCTGMLTEKQNKYLIWIRDFGLALSFFRANNK